MPNHRHLLRIPIKGLLSKKVCWHQPAMGILNRCRWFGTELSFVGFYKVHFFKVWNKTTRIETHKWQLGAEPPTSTEDTHWQDWTHRASVASFVAEMRCCPSYFLSVNDERWLFLKKIVETCFFLHWNTSQLATTMCDFSAYCKAKHILGQLMIANL